MAGLPSHGGRRPRCIVPAGRRATCGRHGSRGHRRLYFHGAQGRRRRRYREAIPAHALGGRPSRAAPAREPRKGRKGQRRGRRGGARPEVEVVEAECRVGELVRPQGVRHEVDGGREEQGFGTRGNIFIL